MDKKYYFDKEKEFDEDVKPVLKALIRTCEAYGISFVAGFHINQNEETHTIAVTKCLSPSGRRLDKFHIAAQILESDGAGLIEVNSPEEAQKLLSELKSSGSIKDLAKYLKKHDN